MTNYLTNDKHRILQEFKNFTDNISDNDLLFKLSIYAIYDEKLDHKWGSQSVKIISSMIKYLNTNVTLNYAAPLITGSVKFNFYKYKLSIIKLFEFFHDPLQKECICEFGTSNHATVLQLIKLGGFINVVYTNTGYGLNMTDKSVHVSGKNYWNMYPSIYIENTLSQFEKFVQHIAPYIIYKYCKTDNITLNTYCDYLSIPELKITNAKTKYEQTYRSMYNADNDLNYFTSLREMFISKIDLPFNVHDDITNDEKIQKMLEDFIVALDVEKGNLSIVLPIEHYQHMALSTIEGIVHNKKVYFLDQKQGTCTYRSALFAWLYNQCSFDVPISTIIDNFKKMCTELYQHLKKYISANIDSPKEHFNIYKTTEYLVNDDLIDEKYLYKNLFKNYFNDKFKIKENVKTNQTISIFPTLTDAEIKVTIDEIRDKKIDADEIHRRCFLSKINSSLRDKMKIDEVIYADFLKDEIFLLSLCEYYNNRDEYKSLYDNADEYSYNICMNTGRINLIYHEALWISKYLFLMYENPQQVNRSFLGKIMKHTDCSFCDQILPLIGYHTRVSYMSGEIDGLNKLSINTTYDLKSLYQTLIFDDPNLLTYKRMDIDYYINHSEYNSKEFAIIDLLSAKQMLLEYIDSNYMNLKIEPNSAAFIDRTLDALFIFIVSNSFYFGEYKTKCALLALIKNTINNTNDYNFAYDQSFLNFLFSNYYLSPSNITSPDGKSTFIGSHMDWTHNLALKVAGVFSFSKKTDLPLILIDSSEIIEIIKNAFNIYGNDFPKIINYLDNYVFGSNSVINNTRIKICGDKFIIDGNDTKIINTNSNFLTQLSNNIVLDSNILLYSSSNNTIYILFNLFNYYSAHDKIKNTISIKNTTPIMSLKLENVSADEYKILKNEIYIDNIKATFIEDSEIIYPFFIYKRDLCFNFMLEYEDKYSLLYIYNKWENNSDVFARTVYPTKRMYPDNPKKSVYLEMFFKNNLIVPVYTSFVKDCFEIIKYCKFIYPFVNNKCSEHLFKIIKNDPSPTSTDKIDFRILQIYSRVVQTISDKWKNITVNTEAVKKSLSTQVELKKIKYDISSCEYCIKTGLNILPTISEITDQAKIYSDEGITLEEHLEKFIKDNPVCKATLTNFPLADDTIEGIVDVIDIAKNNLTAILKTQISSTVMDYSDINKKDYSLVDLILKNFVNLSLVLKINIYLQQLRRLLKIFSKPIDCNEIMEINNLLDVPIITRKTYLSGIIEIILAIIIKKEQWDKYELINKNYTDKSKWNVHHFMMGKGKSSVITPLLAINNLDKPINIIVPSHLIKQTKDTMHEFTLMFNINLNIKDDTTVKHEYLMGTLPITDNIYLIDEFDYMCNPLQSNYNLIISSKSQYDIKILNDLIDLFNSLGYYKSSNIFNTTKINPDLITKYSHLEEAYKVIKNSYFVQNLSYGMSKQYRESRYCIPYLRKDSPLEGSNFKSNIITLVLTIMYFYNNDFIFENNDFYNIILKKNTELIIKLSSYYSADIRLFKLSTIDVLLDFIKDFNHDGEDKLQQRYEIFIIYISMIMSSIKESIEIKNTSFYDIMNMDSLWQVGYSGTVNIILPDYPSFTKYSTDIMSDYDEILGSYFALTGTYSNSKNSIFKLDTYEEVLNIFIDPKYNVLIDACALLKNIKNEKIAEDLSRINNKRVVYLTENDDKMTFYDGIHSPYTGVVYDSDKVIFYYSQKHIVGVDFKQPNILNGIVLINDSNNYTEVAQAIYRMRKLNRGHIANIGYSGTESEILLLNKNSKIVLYKNLVKNDIYQRNNTQNLSLLLLFKHFFRKYINGTDPTKATENFLTPLYKLNNVENNIFGVIAKNFAVNIFKDTSTVLSIFSNPIYNQTNLKTYLTNFYDRLRTSPYSTDLSRMFDKFNHMTLNDFLTIFYDISEEDKTSQITIETNVEMEIEVEQDTQVERQKQVQFTKSFSLSDLITKQLSTVLCRYYYNSSATVDNYNYEWFMYKLHGYDVQFSTNLLMVLPDDILSLCVVRLNNNSFLLENIYTAEFYYNIYPIYSMTGIIINQHNVPTTNQFTTEAMNFLYIDLTNLFDVDIKLDDVVFCMGNLIGKQKTTNITDLSENSLLDKKYIFTMLLLINYYSQFDSTAININEENIKKFCDMSVCIKRLVDYDNVEYARYIYPMIKDHLNREIITYQLSNIVPFQNKYNYFAHEYKILKFFNYDNNTMIGGSIHSKLKKFKIINQSFTKKLNK
jgi:hypothetical protein